MDFLKEELKKLREAGLLRTLRVLEGAQGNRIRIEGKEYIAFCSNDYLGLAASEELIRAARGAMEKYGFGAGAARLVTGTSREHIDLERQIAAFEGTEDAIVFSTGYMANIGAITSLVGEGDLVIGDRLNHGSIVDGCRLSRATFRVYAHRDMAQLEWCLKRAKLFGRTLVVTDTVFSMEGDIAPLGDICELCRKYGAMLMVDEAHATGVFGERGRGVCEQFGVEGDVDVRMGTLSKAVGSFGGFVAGRKELIDYLRNKARTFILTTAPPPAVCAAAREGLRIIAERPELRERLWRNVESVKAVLRDADVPFMDGGTPIIPIVVGEASRAVEISRMLRDSGILIPPIRPPAVPTGSSRLRLTVSAAHTEEDIEALGRAMRDIAPSLRK